MKSFQTKQKKNTANKFDELWTHNKIVTKWGIINIKFDIFNNKLMNKQMNIYFVYLNKLKYCKKVSH